MSTWILIFVLQATGGGRPVIYEITGFPSQTVCEEAKKKSYRELDRPGIWITVSCIQK